MNSYPVFDPQSALRRLANNRALLEKLIALFIHQADSFVMKLCTSGTDDISALAFNVHSLKGSAGEVGATRLYHKLFAVEQTLRHAPEEVTDDDLKLLKKEVHDVLEEITQF